MPSLTTKTYRRLIFITLVWTCIYIFFFHTSQKPNRLSPNDYFKNHKLIQRIRNISENDLLIDKSQKKAEKELFSELELKLPNLPLVYLNEKKNLSKKNQTCDHFPNIYDINLNNIYWQETDTSNGTFYLYGAYLDVRKSNRLGPTVRILGMINR